MTLMRPEYVRVDYQICPDELAGLAAKGLFHDPNFAVPPGLVGNVIEIPCDITYCGIYDTLVGAAGINHALDLSTDKWKSGYVTLFDTCKQSELAAQITRGEVSMDRVQAAEMGVDAGYEPVARDTDELHTTSRLPQSVAEDYAIAQKIEQGIEERVSEAASMRAAMRDDATASEILAEVRKEINRKEEGKSRNAAKLYDLLKQRVNSDVKPSDTKLDTPLDDGYTQTESVVKNPAKEREKESERSGQKSAKAAQQVDVALDNQALNRGETDIAGHGAASEIASQRERISAAEGQVPQHGTQSHESERYL
jgi:hypothetical protein